MTAFGASDSLSPPTVVVIRLLMEPITYANGSTLEDPAISYGIVFSNFMSKGVFTFQGGTDKLIGQMEAELNNSGVDVRINCDATKINTRGEQVESVDISSKGTTRSIRCDAVVSNANIRATIFSLVGKEKFDRNFVDEAQAVRLNNSSTQVYMALAEDDLLDVKELGDLLFSSTAPYFRTDALLSRDITSRTYSFYYPKTRPEGRPRCLMVSSTNARYEDWADLPEEEYRASKRDLVDTTLDALDKYVPNVRQRVVHVEASTPRSFRHYTHHPAGASFGTKFEGLAVSRALPQQIQGLYHAGSVGIIMSGWLGAMNYGVIVANEVENQLMDSAAASATPVAPAI